MVYSRSFSLIEMLHRGSFRARGRGQAAKWLLAVSVLLVIVFVWTRLYVKTKTRDQNDKWAQATSEESDRTARSRSTTIPRLTQIHPASLHYTVAPRPRSSTAAVIEFRSSNAPKTKTTPPPKKSKKTTQKTTQSHSTFFEEALNGTNDVHINAKRGFWTGSDTGRYHRSHFGNGTAKKLVRFFLSVGARSVIDLGSGDGEYSRRLLAAGLHVSCYDGNPDTQLVSNGTCAVLDLTRPVHVAPHDWALSFSVGRQIPPEYEQTFIANMDASNKKGIVLFWGDSRHDATGRRSVRSNAEVVRNFTRLGYRYRYDAVASEKLMGGRKVVEAHKGYSAVVLRKREREGTWHGWQDEIRIAAVCCSLAKLRDISIMLKAVVLFTQHVTKLTVYVFSDEETTPELKKQLEKLSAEAVETGLYHFYYEVHSTKFPEEIPETIPWREVFKPCSLQRLFLPDVLPTVDSVLYLDADTLPIANLSSLWSHFSTMNSTQFTALVPITEPGSGRSSFTDRKIPHYGPMGLNCGLALMNLTRMREARFVERIVALRAETESARQASGSGDQFLQNVFFSRHPEYVLELPCDWNFRRYHCHCNRRVGAGCACKPAMEQGVSLLHGTKEAFNEPRKADVSAPPGVLTRYAPLYRNVSVLFEVRHLREWSDTGAGAGWQEAEAQLGSIFDKVPEEHKCFVNSSAIFFQPLTTYFKNLVSTRM